MTLDLAHLRRVAEAGAKGNWQQDPEDSWSICTNDNVCVAYAQGCVNADHIAACNPATILALLARLEAAERVLREYEAWEGDIIMSADWRNEMPRLTQSQWDKMMKIQAARNEALATHTALTRESGK